MHPNLVKEFVSLTKAQDLADSLPTNDRVKSCYREQVTIIKYVRSELNHMKGFLYVQ